MTIIFDFILPMVAGWMCGMIVNYLSDTLPVTRKLSHPICLSCGNQMGYINYFLWPRLCQKCSQPRRLRVWIVELFLVVASLWLWRHAPVHLGYLSGMVLLAYFVLVTVIDFEHRLILHIVSLVGLLFGLIVGIRLHGSLPTLIGGTAGFLCMLALYSLGFLYLRLSARLRGKQPEESEALGFGDVNLSGVIGLLLGWPGIVGGLGLAILLGGLVSLLYLLFTLLRRQYNPNNSLPYGPFLAISAVILLYLKGLLF